MAVQPLTIAVVAGVLLVVSIGLDAAINRTYYVDVEQPDGWHQVAAEPVRSQTFSPIYPAAGGLSVDPNGSITLRVRLDNGYPWALGETARLIDQANGTILAEKRVDAPARGEGSAIFTFAARPYFDRATTASPPGAKLGPGSVYATLLVEVGSKTISAYLQLEAVTS